MSIDPRRRGRETYGFRYEYSRAGNHPLQAWNGELPGTLPMICGTGEAPCAVVPHRGYLWVTSWGDHRIGTLSIGTARHVLLSGKRKSSCKEMPTFVPPALAIAPDGALCFCRLGGS